jgi:imidazolonepropionase-like amidohydrolase
VIAGAILVAGAVPAEAQSQADVHAIRGATVHTLTGPAIESGTVVISDGRIVAVGAGVAVPPDATVIEATGLHVYPGLFDAESSLGLGEIGSVSATEDASEIARYNPQLTAATAVHPASEHIPVARADGVTHTLSSPSGGVIAGQASLINLAGWTVEEMLVKRSAALILNFPTIQTSSFSFATFQVETRPFKEAKKQYDERIAELEEWLAAAKHYAEARAAGNAAVDLKLDALAMVMQEQLPVIFLVNSERDIRNAVEFAEKHDLNVVIGGGAEAWKVRDLLAEKEIPVILGPTLSMPAGEDERYNEAYSRPAMLHEAGVKIAIATFSNTGFTRLPFEASNAVPYGLPWEEAIRAVTLNPAQILGVDDQLGTIEEGKMANLIVTDGDPLEIQTQIVHVFVGGKPASMDNKALELYERYRSRPQQ